MIAMIFGLFLSPARRSLLEVDKKHNTQDRHRQASGQSLFVSDLSSPSASIGHVSVHLFVKRVLHAFAVAADVAQKLEVVAPIPSPTEPTTSLQSEVQVSRHINHLKDLLRMNQLQLTAGMGAAGLLKSGFHQNPPASSNFNSFPVVPISAFTPIMPRAWPYSPNMLGSPFTHNADATQCTSDNIIVSVPSRPNSIPLSAKFDPATPVLTPSGFVRRQA
jgi:hypothetical protein